MCLTTSRRPRSGDPRSGIGYQVITGPKIHPRSAIYDARISFGVLEERAFRRTWSTMIEGHDGKKYPVGFHIWRTLRAAREYRETLESFHHAKPRVVRVEWKVPLAFGTKNGHEVIVAKRRKVVRVLEGRKKSARRKQ